MQLGAHCQQLSPILTQPGEPSWSTYSINRLKWRDRGCCSVLQWSALSMVPLKKKKTRPSKKAKSNRSHSARQWSRSHFSQWISTEPQQKASAHQQYGSSEISRRFCKADFSAISAGAPSLERAVIDTYVLQQQMECPLRGFLNEGGVLVANEVKFRWRMLFLSPPAAVFISSDLWRLSSECRGFLLCYVFYSCNVFYQLKGIFFLHFTSRTMSILCYFAFHAQVKAKQTRRWRKQSTGSYL